jgi:alpha-D-ribose 1-methylphosphonate 5-triphosphate diphosphatase
MKRSDFIIENASIVTPFRTLKGGSMKIEDGIISEIKEGAIHSNGTRRICVDGKYVLPGFIDLHSDAIEKEIEPRPNSQFPVNIALFELDKKLASCGITTIFHSLSFAEGEIGVRSNKTAAGIVKEISRLTQKMSVQTKVHARFEITTDGAIPYLESLLKEGCINLLSFMDHTPGQGQFKEIHSFKNYFGPVYKKSDAELEEMIKRKLALQETVKSRIEYIAAICKSMGVPMASHDDDSEEKILWLNRMEIRLSEFPVNIEAVRAAKNSGISICLGSPNALRGNSQGNNLSAREALSSGYGDILCSDYAPMTILHAVFTLAGLGILPLHNAVNLVSLNPAKTVGISEQTGSIEEGKKADFIIVDFNDEVPKASKTIVSGQEVFSAC